MLSGLRKKSIQESSMNFSETSGRWMKIAAFAFMLGCAEISAQPEEVKTVIIMVGEQGPDGCELLGKAKGSSKDGSTNEAEDHTPYIERLIKARNNLRNEAQKLGGNNVHIIYSNNTGKYEIPGIDKEIIFVGNVYRCQ
jgi:hypothetical protein